MIIKDGINNHHHICSCCCNTINHDLNASNEEAKNATIPVYYSHQHALDSGWGYTNDPQYSNPDGPASYICPDCMDKLGLKQASI